MEASRSRKDRAIKLHERTEFGRRLIAVRTLRGLEQDELAGLYEAKGGSWSQIGIWERRRQESGEPAVTEIQFYALSLALEVNNVERWFTKPELLPAGLPPTEIAATIERLREQLQRDFRRHLTPEQADELSQELREDEREDEPGTGASNSPEPS